MILVLGGVSYDTMIYLDKLPAPVPATIFAKGTQRAIGSTGAGKALALHRLGLPTLLHAYCGDDAEGATIRAHFEQEGLEFHGDIDPVGTEQHVNLMAADGGRLSIYVNSATFNPPLDLARFTPLLERADMVALNIINYCRHLIPMIQVRQLPIWCDLHDFDGKNPYHADFIAAASVLFFSGDAMPTPRDFMQTMVAQGKQLVVCTFGKAGSLALTAEGEWIETPALPYPLVDSSGAGDNFFAGVLYGVMQGYPLPIALRLGTVAGGLAVTSRDLVAEGFNEALLWRDYRRVWGDVPSPTQ